MLTISIGYIRETVSPPGKHTLFVSVSAAAATVPRHRIALWPSLDEDEPHFDPRYFDNAKGGLLVAPAVAPWSVVVTGVGRADAVTIVVVLLIDK